MLMASTCIPPPKNMDEGRKWLWPSNRKEFDNAQARHPAWWNTGVIAAATDKLWKLGTHPAREIRDLFQKWGTTANKIHDQHALDMYDPFQKLSLNDPQQATDVGNLIYNETLGGAFGDVSLPKGEKFDEWQKARYAENNIAYDALTSEGKRVRGAIYDTIEKGTRDRAIASAKNLLGDKDKVNPGLAERVIDNKMTTQDKATHGEEELDAIRKMAHPYADSGPYVPLTRDKGNHVVLGRIQVDAPTKGVTKDLSDPATGEKKWEFSNKQNADDFGNNLPMKPKRDSYVTDAAGNRDYSITTPDGKTTKIAYTAEDLKDNPATLQRRWTVKSRDAWRQYDYMKTFDTETAARAHKADLEASNEFEPGSIHYTPKEYHSPEGRANLITQLGYQGEKTLKGNPLYDKLPPAQQRAMEDALHQSIINGLGNSQLVNSRMHRAGIAGFNNDLLQSIHSWSGQHAAAMSALEHSRPIADAVDEIFAQAKEFMGKGEDRRANIMTEIGNEMRKRADTLQQGDITGNQAVYGPALHRMLMWSSMYRLLTPAFMARNSTQNFTHAWPIQKAMAIGAKLNGSATGYLTRAMKDVGYINLLKGAGNEAYNLATKGEITKTALGNLFKAISDKGEKVALQKLMDVGLLSRDQMTLAGGLRPQDLERKGVNLEGIFGTQPTNRARDVAEGTLNGLNAAMFWTNKVSQPLQNAVEIFNRASTFLSGYRQHLDTHNDTDAAFEHGLELVRQAHVQYSRADMPAWEQRLQRGLAAMPLQFKQFAIQQYANYFKSFAAIASKDPDERKMGMAMLGGIMGTHAVVAGMMGLPGIEIARMAMNAGRATGISNKTWDDIQESATQYIHAMTGSKTLTSMALNGVPNIVGANLNPGLGLNNGIFINDPPDSGRSKDFYNEQLQWLAQLLTGAPSAMVMDMMQGFRDMESGDPLSWGEKIAKVLPHLVPIKIVGDIPKAIEGYTEGPKGPKGEPRGPKYTGYQAGLKAAGFPLTKEGERGFAAHELSKTRNQNQEKTELAINTWLRADTTQAKSAAWKDAVAQGIKGQTLVKAATELRKTQQPNRNVNGLVLPNKPWLPKNKALTDIVNTQRND
jgi:hypothetical protein